MKYAQDNMYFSLLMILMVYLYTGVSQFNAQHASKMISLAGLCHSTIFTLEHTFTIAADYTRWGYDHTTIQAHLVPGPHHRVKPLITLPTSGTWTHNIRITRRNHINRNFIKLILVQSLSGNKAKYYNFHTTPSKYQTLKYIYIWHIWRFQLILNHNISNL